MSNTVSNTGSIDFSIVELKEKENGLAVKEEEDNEKNTIRNDWRKVTELDLMFAARLVKDAKELRNLNFKKSEPDLKYYDVYLDYRVVWALSFIYLIHLMIPLIEEPSLDSLKVPFWVPCCIEIFCLTVFLLRLLHAKMFQQKDSFYKDVKNYVIFFTIIIIIIDIIIFISLKFHDETNPVRRYTRALRVLIYINSNEGKELRRAFRNVRKTLPDIFNVFALFFFSILIFGLVAWQLFKEKADKKFIYYNNQPYFQYYEDSIWDLYTSVTTANFPDVMMPAYNLNGAYSIFFIFFMLVNLFIFINIILATIYTNYKKHLKEEVISTIKLKLTKSRDAFDLIKEPLQNTHNVANLKDRCGITFNTFQKLIKLIDPKKSDNQIKIFFEIMDFNQAKFLVYEEFIYLADLLNIRVSEIKDLQNIFELYIPGFYNNKFSRIIKRFVRHGIFQLTFLSLIAINIIFIVFNDKNKIEWFFISAFLIEIFMKIYVYGFYKFVKDYWNIFDTFVVGGGIIIGIISETQDKYETTQFFEVVLILRSLRLIKFLASVERFRTIITTIAIITPSLVTYAMLLLTIYYVFSMIGMELFGDTIKTSKNIGDDCSVPKLNGSDFARFQYCKNNFSSFTNSLVLLFELMVVNQWHILSKGFEDAKGSKWTRLYFLAFHLICVIISLNIFTAFVIEAFMLEYESKDNKTTDFNKLELRIKELGLEFTDEANGHASTNSANKSVFQKLSIFLTTLKEVFIFNDDDDSTKKSIGEIKFHINSREAKPVEILLQRMFSNELDIANENFLNS